MYESRAPMDFIGAFLWTSVLFLIESLSLMTELNTGLTDSDPINYVYLKRSVDGVLQFVNFYFDRNPYADYVWVQIGNLIIKISADFELSDLMLYFPKQVVKHSFSPNEKSEFVDGLEKKLSEIRARRVH